MADDESNSNYSRRRSARISKKRKEPFLMLSSTLTSRAKRPHVDPSFNPYRKQKKGKINASESSSISTTHTMSSDDEDEEGVDNITPAAFGPKKGPVHTYVSLSTSTTATAPGIIEKQGPKEVPNGKSKRKSIHDAEAHSLRRLPVLEDDRDRRMSRRTRTSSRIKQSSSQSSVMTGTSKYTRRSKSNRSSSNENVDLSGTSERAKRKIDALKQEREIAEKHVQMNKIAILTAQRLSTNKGKGKTKGKTKNKKKGVVDHEESLKFLPPIFNFVPNGIFNLDSMHKSALSLHNQTKPFHDTDNLLITTNAKKKTRSTNVLQVVPKIQINIITTRDATGSMLSNDDDICFLSQYSLDYYNYLFEKDKRMTTPFISSTGKTVSSSTFRFTLPNANHDTETTTTNTRRKIHLRSSRSKKSPEKDIFIASRTSKTSRTDKDSKNVPNYMKIQTHLATFMRAILVDWLIEISDEYKLQTITLHTAVKLMDRALEFLVIQRKDLQCLGCACMLIACKLEEVTPMTSADFVYVSDKTYTRKEITKMERDIFNALQFRLYEKVTPLHFLHRFIRASDVSFYENSDHDENGSTGKHVGGGECFMNGTITWGANPTFQYMTEYLVELALLQPEFVDMKASSIAAAVLYLARATLGMKDINGNIWNKTLSFYTTNDSDDLEDIVLKLHAAHSAIHEEKLSCIANKYKRKHFYEVSLRPTILKEDLGFS